MGKPEELSEAEYEAIYGKDGGGPPRYTYVWRWTSKIEFFIQIGNQRVFFEKMPGTGKMVPKAGMDFLQPWQQRKVQEQANLILSQVHTGVLRSPFSRTADRPPPPPPPELPPRPPKKQMGFSFNKLSK